MPSPPRGTESHRMIVTLLGGVGRRPVITGQSKHACVCVYVCAWFQGGYTAYRYAQPAAATAAAYSDR